AVRGVAGEGRAGDDRAPGRVQQAARPFGRGVVEELAVLHQQALVGRIEERLDRAGLERRAVAAEHRAPQHDLPPARAVHVERAAHAAEARAVRVRRVAGERRVLDRGRAVADADAARVARAVALEQRALHQQHAAALADGAAADVDAGHVADVVDEAAVLHGERRVDARADGASVAGRGLARIGHG